MTPAKRHALQRLAIVGLMLLATAVIHGCTL